MCRLAELYNRGSTELVAVVFVVVPEARVLLVLDWEVAEHCFCVAFYLLVVLELGLKSFGLKRIF